SDWLCSGGVREGRGRREAARTGFGVLRRFEVLLRELPVHEMVEKDIQIVRPSVLIIEIVGVLPHIGGEQRCVLGIGNGGLGIGCAVDRKLSVCATHKPAIAGAELTSRLLLEYFPELVIAAEILVDLPGKLALRLA